MPSIDKLSRTCVVLVPSGKVDREFEESLKELNRRYKIWRVRQENSPPGFRDRLVNDALHAGYSELLWLDPAVVFDPMDVERLRSHDLPFACGIYPNENGRGFGCEFIDKTTEIWLGKRGMLLPLLSTELRFALIRRPVFEAIAKPNLSKKGSSFFALETTGTTANGQITEDMIFCERVRARGFEIVADTTIRLWRSAVTKLSWEDVGGDRERQDEYKLTVHPSIKVKSTPGPSLSAGEHPEPWRNPLRGLATHLPNHFPRIRLFVLTYPANVESLKPTLESIRESDWGEKPVIVTQPDDWPMGRESGCANYKKAMEFAIDDGCDFALILEDDVRVNRHLRHNILANPLVRRDQCDYLGLFIPDLIADPWERIEAHLGYRLAKPRYIGPKALWERGRVWGSQAYLLSRRMLLAATERWYRLIDSQDTFILGICGELKLPLWYTMPCLVEHVPDTSAFGTPAAYAPDFDLDFRLELKSGFQPPEDIPGWLTVKEAELFFRITAGQDVLELGTACGRASVCIAQQANRFVSVDHADTSEAAEWVKRYDLQNRVEFLRREVFENCPSLTAPFGVIVIDALRDAASLRADIALVLPLLNKGGLLAFHDYPDPFWPDVRLVVDEHASRLRWKRVAQAGFLGVFRT